jgi:7-carboxy-7-deazaguanine synthase
MQIAEIFRSRQGEGRLTGVESVFVRFSGCNLRCRFCDTRYASWTPEGEDLLLDAVLARVADLDRLPAERIPVSWHEDCSAASSKCENSVKGDSPIFVATKIGTVPENIVPYAIISGGEPMLFDELVPLCEAFKAQGRHITIETSGTVYRRVACDLMSISPKLANSTPTPRESPYWAVRHEATRHRPQIVAQLMAEHDYQLKFVVDRPEDCRQMEAYLAELPSVDRKRVMLMPQGVDARELADKGQWLEPHCGQQGLQFCPRRHIEWFGARRGV